MIKVADFGLSENMYSKTYFRQEKDQSIKLPVKWLALEALTEGVFSEKSDVVGFVAEHPCTSGCSCCCLNRPRQVTNDGVKRAWVQIKLLVLCIHFTIDLKLQTNGWWSLSTLPSGITLVTKVVAFNAETLLNSSMPAAVESLVTKCSCLW